MIKPRYDRVTGAELLPPTDIKPYWHAAPEPALPLVARDRDDPYAPAKVSA